MTSPETSRPAGVIAATAVWSAFILVHLWLGWLNLAAPGQPFGDVTSVYASWARDALRFDYAVGIDGPFVYPILALLPMLASAAFGDDLYGSTWLSIVLLLDLCAFAVLVGWRRDRESVRLGWWWTGFLLLLGPIAVGRVDAVSVPLALIGALLLARRPAVASVLLTLGAWIKIWPAAILAAAVIALRSRATVVVAALATSGLIAAAVAALGGAHYLLSFVGTQGARGLQVEAPVSGVWLWGAVLGMPGATVYYDDDILTFQVDGPGVAPVAAAMTPVLALVVAAVALVGLRALRRGMPAHLLLAPLTLALVTALIAVNKVGSPQFVSWLAVPVLLGLSARAAGGVSFLVPGGIVLAIAVLTQLCYPYFYFQMLNGDLLLISALSIRNLLYFVLLGWAVVTLWRSPAGRLQTGIDPRE